MESANSIGRQPHTTHLIDIPKGGAQSSADDRRESNASSGSLLMQQNAMVNANGMASSPGNRHASISSAAGANVPPSGAGRRRASMFDPIDPAELQKTLYQAQLNVRNLSFFCKISATLQKIEFIVNDVSA